MAIQKVDVTVPGGDTPRSANIKINANFSNATHAANRLVGTAVGNVMEVGAFGIGDPKALLRDEARDNLATSVGNFVLSQGVREETEGGALGAGFIMSLPWVGGTTHSIGKQLYFGAYTSEFKFRQRSNLNLPYDPWVTVYHTGNTTIVNGSLKPSSPVVKIHADSLELNDDAEKMGVTLNKRGVGDYLLQNTTGLRNDGGWRIELPQDVNGNPYFAVAYNELENNDIEVKTYKRIFDMNTFMFGPDLDNPVDIKEGRSIAIRFNDLPQETPTNLDKTNL